MSSTQQIFSQGKARGEGEAKGNQWVQSTKDTANSVCDKMSENTQNAQEHKEQAAGFLQQTGEQVMHMAQGATDAVKNAVGMGTTNADTKTTSTTTTTMRH